MNKLQFIILLIIPVGFIAYVGIIIPQEERIITIREIEVRETVKYKRGLELNKEIKKLNDKTELINLLNEKTKSEVISKIILDSAIKNNIPVAFAFSLAWSESRFDPNAINGIHNKNGSSDWGLFQLNDYHRKDWTKEQLLNPKMNTQEAMRVLNRILEDNNQVMAIGIYNAGATGIKRGLPYTTLVHIDNIINYRDTLLDEINEVVLK